MTTFKDIVQDCINGCTAHNIDESHKKFKINYFINQRIDNEIVMQGNKHYCFVFIEDLEDKLREIVKSNLTGSSDVVISHITVLQNDDVIKVNKDSYPFSLDYLMRHL